MVDKKELEFPMEFKKCPACGSAETVGKTVGDEEKAKGKMKPESVAIIENKAVVFYDPKVVSLTCTMLILQTDICLKCGTIYCVKIIKQQMQTAQLQAMMAPAGSPGRGFNPPPGRFS